MDVLVKFPTRSRPKIFRETLRQWQQSPVVRFLVSIDEDDATMNNPEMLAFLNAQPNLKYRIGHSKTKIQAMNDGVADEPWDLLIMAQDDILPTCPDYAERIVKHFERHFPDGDGVLHLFDGYRSDGLNTSVCCDRKYFDRFGTVYHDEYISVFADDEWTAVSTMLGRVAFIPECLLKHEWIRLTGEDVLNRRNESFFARDKEVFERRKLAGFPTNTQRQ